MGEEDEPTQAWGFQVLDGDGEGGRNGVLGGVNHLGEVSGAADLMMRTAGCWWWDNAQSGRALCRWILLTCR